MGTSVFALVPVWGGAAAPRPARRVWNAALEPEAAEMPMLFLISPGDDEEIAELERLGLSYFVVSSRQVTGSGPEPEPRDRMRLRQWSGLLLGDATLRLTPLCGANAHKTLI